MPLQDLVANRAYGSGPRIELRHAKQGWRVRIPRAIWATRVQTVACCPADRGSINLAGQNGFRHPSIAGSAVARTQRSALAISLMAQSFAHLRPLVAHHFPFTHPYNVATPI